MGRSSPASKSRCSRQTLSGRSGSDLRDSESTDHPRSIHSCRCHGGPLWCVFRDVCNVTCCHSSAGASTLHVLASSATFTSDAIQLTSAKAKGLNPLSGGFSITVSCPRVAGLLQWVWHGSSPPLNFFLATLSLMCTT